jgi:hypothetical protein
LDGGEKRKEMDTTKIFEEIKEEVRKFQSDYLSKVQLNILLVIEDIKDPNEKNFWEMYSKIIDLMLKDDNNPYNNILSQVSAVCQEVSYYRGLREGLKTNLDNEQLRQKVKTISDELNISTSKLKDRVDVTNQILNQEETENGKS